LPQGVDTIPFYRILTIWSPDKAIELLRKSYKALPQAGNLLAFNVVGDEGDTGPTSTALGLLRLLAIATGEGMLYSWKITNREFAKRASGASSESQSCHWITGFWWPPNRSFDRDKSPMNPSAEEQRFVE
jgi:hypothetical protein